MAEVWKPVLGYEGRYEVSNQGRVRSVRLGHPKSLRVNSKGYPVVNLKARGVQKTYGVHTLVLGAFVGPRPDGLVTRHLDGDPTNNTLSNLTYGTQSENVLDRRRHGTDRNASKSHCPKGHEYDAANTYFRPDRPRSRGCRACNRVAAAAYAARKKAVAA